MSNLELMLRFGILGVISNIVIGQDYDIFQITPSDWTTLAQDNLGTSVSIYGNSAIASAPEDDRTGAALIGSIYIIERDEITGNWGPQETQKIMPSDGAQYDQFGKSVSIYENTMIVGSYRHAFNGITSGGGAYIYKKDITSGLWTINAKVSGSTTVVNDRCGYSVAISKDAVIIGCYFDGNGGMRNGKVFIFEYDAVSDTWSETAALSGGQSFGYSVSIYDNKYAVIGEWANDVPLTNVGKAYIWKNDQSSGSSQWSQVKELAASDYGSTDQFGWSVSICNDWVLVGSRLHDAPGLTSTGAAYFYKREYDIINNNNDWIEHDIVQATQLRNYAWFGSTVNLNCDANNYYAVISAQEDDYFGSSRGSAYVFDYNSNLDEWVYQSGPTVGTTSYNGDALNSVSAGGGNDGNCWIAGVPNHNDYEAQGYANVGSAFIFCPKAPTSAPTGPTQSPTGPTKSPTPPTSAPTSPTRVPTPPTPFPTSPTSSPTTTCKYSNTCTAWGDPHITSFDNTYYHFQGEGYFYYVKNCETDTKTIPLTVSARHDKCRGDYTCIEEVVVILRDGYDTTISWGDNGVNTNSVVYRPSGVSAIGTHSFTDEHGNPVQYTVKKKYFEIEFIYNGQNVMLKFYYRNRWLQIETTDCLSGTLTLCGLCGNINGMGTDDFKRCDTLVDVNNDGVSDTFEGTPWENTHIFGESCCNSYLDSMFLTESDCGNGPVIPPPPGTECLAGAEYICEEAFIDYCSCDGSTATRDWIRGCAFEMCAMDVCKDGVNELGVGYTLEQAVDDGCLDTVVADCVNDRYYEFVDAL